MDEIYEDEIFGDEAFGAEPFGPRLDCPPRWIGPDEALARAFDEVEQHQYDLNRRAAARASALAYAFEWARTHPSVYAEPGEVDPEGIALRCAALEASARLHLSENAVRSLAATAQMARESLPLLWARAREGFAALAHVEAAVGMLGPFADDDEALAAFDHALAELVMEASPASFRRRAHTLARRLAPESWPALHARARAKRHVALESADDGMSMLHALVPTIEGRAIMRRLTATAKCMPIAERRGRSRGQIRSDLFVSWLTGEGTVTAVRTKVFVTVPLDRLGEKAQASVRRGIAPTNGIDLNAEARLLGDGPIDHVTGIQALLDAGAFTRVVTDPVTGVVLDMDRRARTVTRAQREWLALVHGECTRDGCSRLAVDAEIDHWVGFHSSGRGPTDLVNLHPLCASDHRLKDRTKIAYRRRTDSSVQLRFPTSFVTQTRKRYDPPEPLPADPPF